MSLFLTLLILALPNVADTVSVIRVNFAAVLLASQAMTACSHSHAPRTAVDMASVPQEEAVRVTTVGVDLIAQLNSSVQEALQSALVMGSAFPQESASALQATQGMRVKQDPQSVHRIAPVTATAVRLRNVCAMMALLV